MKFTPNGLVVIHLQDAPYRKRRFAICGTNNVNVVVETVNKDGSWSKRQVKALWDRCFNTTQEAMRAIEEWDRGTGYYRGGS